MDASTNVSESASTSLSFAEALAPPCRECHALCCSYLPLQVVPVRTLMEADYVRFLLGFPLLRAGFAVNGQWSIYYTAPCRHFDLAARRCRVHGTWEQPRTCVAYNEHDCWYQRAISPDSRGFLLFDRARFERLLALMAFDRERNIVSVPSWSEMADLCAALPLAVQPEEAPGANDAVPPPEAGDALPRELAMADLRVDPCEGCSAPCCRYLYFPLAAPLAFMQVDYIRFCLNFPGLECAVSPTSWWLLLRADCRFLQAGSNRCSAYGTPERPLRCTHLNQWDCSQYRQLVSGDSGGLFRMGRDAFAQIAEQMRFDGNGRIVYLPAGLSAIAGQAGREQAEAGHSTGSHPSP